MAARKKSQPTSSSSWWNERGKIMAMRSEVKAEKPKAKRKVRTKKASKAETGQTYYCEACGCEMVCAASSSGEVVCCGEPMVLVC